MEEVMIQSTIMAMDKAGNVVIDIESLKHQPPDKRCCGSSKSLVRKSSCRMEKQEMDEPSKNLFVKVLPPLLDQLKPPLVQNKALITVPSVLNSPISADSGDGRSRRFQRWKTIHPRKILLFFATIIFDEVGIGFPPLVASFVEHLIFFGRFFGATMETEKA